jgi:hypothetical protein
MGRGWFARKLAAKTPRPPRNTGIEPPRRQDAKKIKEHGYQNMKIQE